MGKVVRLGWMQVDVTGRDVEVDRKEEWRFFLSHVGMRIKLRQN